MEDKTHETSQVDTPINTEQSNTNIVAAAILIAGIIIAGAILLRGSKPAQSHDTIALKDSTLQAITLAPVSSTDRVLGNSESKLTLVLYEDFQCPYCGRFFQDSEQLVRNTYVKDGSVKLVYRDFPFLGVESVQAAKAARCAEDQGKFWEYHDYLYAHQNGENQGNFSDPNLKSFATSIGLNANSFNTCLNQNTHATDVANSKAEASKAGVMGTPKGFIIAKNNISDKAQDEILKSLDQTKNDPQPKVSFFSTRNIVSINGALPSAMVKSVIDILLKYN